MTSPNEHAFHMGWQRSAARLNHATRRQLRKAIKSGAGDEFALGWYLQRLFALIASGAAPAHPWFTMAHLSDGEKAEMRATMERYRMLNREQLQAEIVARGLPGDDDRGDHMRLRLAYHDTGLEPCAVLEAS